MAAETTYRRHEAVLPSSAPAAGAGGRVLLAALSLVLAFAAAVVLLLALGWIDQSRLDLFDPLIAPVMRVAQRNPMGQLVVALSALVVGLLAALLALRGLSGGRSAPRAGTQRHILAADEKGLVVVEGTGVATVAAAAAKRAPGVMDVRVVVAGSGSAPVRLHVTARVSAAAELQKAGAAVRRLAAEAVQSLVGIDVSEVLVKIEVVPLEELGRDLQ